MSGWTESEMFHVKQFERLLAFANANHMEIGETEEKQFADLCSLLIETNKHMNLTTITDPDEIEIKHFIDSISAAPVIKQLWSETLFEKSNQIDMKDCGFRLVDVGTGAGFPGIPLKIVFPKAEFLLLDSLEKRIGYVNRVIEELQLDNISAMAGRVEDIAKPGNVSRETFDFCVTRAVANTAVLAEYCLPLVRVNGYCILYKSGDFEQELKEAENAIKILGGKVVDIVELKLFGSDADRSLIVIRKIKAAPEKYPRRPGKPSKSPIK